MRLLGVIRALGGIAAIGMTSFLSPANAADTFSADQKAAIERIVRSYLLENPELLVEVSLALETKRSAEEAAATAKVITERHDEIYNDGFSPSVGSPDAPITIVEYFDYNCGYCRKAFDTILDLAETQKDIKVIFKEMPVLGEESMSAALASLAAARQGKFLQFHRTLMTYDGRISEAAVTDTAKKTGLDMAKFAKDRNDPALRAVVDANLAEADALYFTGTPSFIVDGKTVPGWSEREIMRIIEEARKS